jgi:uncharacterized protein with von Willebrand factor type A (vWA) domain
VHLFERLAFMARRTSFIELRNAKVPVTLKEYLSLLEAMDKGVVGGDGGNEVQDFYYLVARGAGEGREASRPVRQGVRHRLQGTRLFSEGVDVHQFPEEWLKKLSEKFLTEEEKKQIEAMGGWDKLMETLKQRMEEQQKRHQGGNKMIGTAGTSPYGAHGYNPEGVRIGQDKSRHQRAVKVWDKREFKNLDDTVEIGTRNLKVALRRLRKWARDGAAEELDSTARSSSTAKQGYIDIVMRPERRNAVKLLMFLDIGGSMDPHVKACEELFSAARPSSRISSSSISTTASTRACGRTIAGAASARSRHGMCCTSFPRTTKSSCSSATLR